MKKGFTLVEMISIIIILSVIAVLSFSSMTKTIKNVDTEELTAYKNQLENICSVYVEAFIDNHFISSNTEDITLTTLINEKFVSSSLSNPTNCRTENIVITAKKESNKTVSYQVRCLENGVYSELKKAS